jgi:hypothetical protein
MRWGRVARLMQSIKEPGWEKNHTKEIKRHRSFPDIYASKTVVNAPGFTGGGMTCEPREREGLAPWERKLSGNGFGGMVFEHKRRRHRRRAGLHAPIQRIWYAASVYTIHWQS